MTIRQYNTEIELARRVARAWDTRPVDPEHGRIVNHTSGNVYVARFDRYAVVGTAYDADNGCWYVCRPFVDDDGDVVEFQTLPNERWYDTIEDAARRVRELENSHVYYHHRRP